MINIPLTAGASNADVTFRSQLGENTVVFRQLYRTLTGKWMISATIDSAPIFNGVMLLVGGDLLQSFNISDSFGKLYLIGEDPTLDTLGVTSQLIWVAPNE